MNSKARETGLLRGLQILVLKTFETLYQIKIKMTHERKTPAFFIYIFTQSNPSFVVLTFQNSGCEREFKVLNLKSVLFPVYFKDKNAGKTEGKINPSGVLNGKARRN